MMDKVPKKKIVLVKFSSTVFSILGFFTLQDRTNYYSMRSTGKCKAVLLQAWSGPEGSRKLRFPDFMTTA